MKKIWKHTAFLMSSAIMMVMSTLQTFAGNGGPSVMTQGNPATGDTSGMMLGIMAVLLGASLLAIVAVAVISAKKKKK